MDSTVSGLQTTPSPSQRRHSLLELSEKFRQLANMQIKQEIEDVKSVPEFRDLIHQLCQEAPAIAQVIAVAIREKIPDPSPRLSSKRKRGHDPSYRPSHLVQPISKRQCTDDISAVDEPMTPESPIPECEIPETEDALESMICVDSAELRSAYEHESRLDVHSTALIMNEENPARIEDVQYNTVPTSPDGEHKESRAIPEEDLTEDVSFLDTVYHAVNIINQIKKYPNGPPQAVHIQILQTFQTNQMTTVESNRGQWSDGTMWMQVLEGSSASNRRYTILNMLEYMGASKWYDDQIELAQRTVYTKENKAVAWKGAASHVLNRITREHGSLNKKLITNQLSRGKKLRMKLVKNLGLGILFSPKIWNYTKRSMTQLDRLVTYFLADTQRMALLKILSGQVERLVNNSCTDPEALYISLREHSLISQEELQKIRSSHESEHDALPEGTLERAFNQLTSQVSTQVFNKRSLDYHDTFIINDNLKRPAPILSSLRPGQWLDCWVLQVAMEISDRPTSVRFCESIPVNDIKRHDRIKPLKKPFEAWVKEIAELRKKAESGLESCTSLIFYAPICHTHSHFTLLEINDGEKVIRHYDSLAKPTTINGTKKTRFAALVEDEFGHLGYKYIEMPTPQQSDNWSCGARVIWNFRRRCNGFEIGSWDTVLDSERIQLDIVNSLMACIDSNAMQKYSRRRERGIRENTSFSDMLGEEGSKQSGVELTCID
ncbi:hypothetical protein EYB26_005296 [Talaromyces marneffei]|uniref:uncharacterized protein n=1 Tax=Talaromyces marneffei TaxID=37727 RepID=UPI0012A91D97|nr:uncharacterized protein EYB26_005296 [Talaromyces marneffei]QGA17621.1 hypothetical protein EYB26_005296 [Talaromyces marneffei]